MLLGQFVSEPEKRRRAPVRAGFLSWLVSTPGDRDLTRVAILDEGIVPRLIK
jgi:hypothetical protein